jgi:PAS domain-containing protein
MTDDDRTNLQLGEEGRMLQLPLADRQAERELPASAEPTLQESETRFFNAFEYAAIDMALVAPDGRWLRVNRALCDLVGYTPEELRGKTFQDITHPEDLATDLEHVRQMLAGNLRSYQCVDILEGKSERKLCRAQPQRTAPSLTGDYRSSKVPGRLFPRPGR